MKISLLDKCILKIAKFNYADKAKSLFMLATSPNENEATNAAMLAVNMMKSNNLIFSDIVSNVADRANKQLQSIDKDYPKDKLVNFGRAAARYLIANKIQIIEGEPNFGAVDNLSEPATFDGSIFSRLVREDRTFFKPIEVGKFTVSLQASRYEACKPKETYPMGNMYTEFRVTFWETASNEDFINPLQDERFANLPWAKYFEKSDFQYDGLYMPRGAILMMINDLIRLSNKTTAKNNENFDGSLFGRLVRNIQTIGKLKQYYFEPINLGRFTISIQASSEHYSTPRKNLESGNQYSEFEVAFWESNDPRQKLINPLKDDRFSNLPWAEEFRLNHTVGAYLSRNVILEIIADLKRIGGQKEIDKSYDSLPSDLFNED